MKRSSSSSSPSPMQIDQPSGAPSGSKPPEADDLALDEHLEAISNLVTEMGKACSQLSKTYQTGKLVVEKNQKDLLESSTRLAALKRKVDEMELQQQPEAKRFKSPPPEKDPHPTPAAAMGAAAMGTSKSPKDQPEKNQAPPSTPTTMIPIPSPLASMTAEEDVTVKLFFGTVDPLVSRFKEAYSKLQEAVKAQQVAFDKMSKDIMENKDKITEYEEKLAGKEGRD